MKIFSRAAVLGSSRERQSERFLRAAWCQPVKGTTKQDEIMASKRRGKGPRGLEKGTRPRLS